MAKNEKEKMEMMMLLEMFSNYSITAGSNHVLTKGKKLPNGYEIKSELWDYLTYGKELEGMDGLNTFIKGFFNECKERKNPEELAEFVCIINHKSWYWAGKNDKLASFYSDWYYEAHDWCMNNLKGNDLKRYYDIVN